MAFKETFGSAARPVVGVSAVAIAAAIGYFVFTGQSAEDVAPPEQPEVAVQNAAKTQTPASGPAETTTTSVTEASASDESQKPVELVTIARSTETTPVLKIPEILPVQKTEEPVEDQEAVAEPEAETDIEASEITNTSPKDTSILEPLAMIAPSFDLVRIAPEGFSTVAGSAEPGSDVVILVDGVEVSRAAAASSGDFVALFEIAASDVPRELQLLALLNGTQTRSDSSIIVAPALVREIAQAEPVVDAPSTEATADVESAAVQDSAESASVEVAEDTTPVAAAVEPAASALTSAQGTQAQSTKALNTEVQSTAADSALVEEVVEPVAENIVLPDEISAPAPIQSAATSAGAINEAEQTSSELASPLPENTQAAPSQTMPDVQEEAIEPPQAVTQPQTQTVLKADDEGVKVLQSAPLQSEVIIDAITYDPSGAVFASGRAVAGSVIRLYLNNEVLTETVTGADGQWRSELDVDAGIYALRADMLDAQGEVQSRVEIPFKREDIAVLARLSGLETPDTPQVLEQAQAPTAEPVDATEPDSAEILDSAVAEQNVPPQPRIASVTVQPGNTLWGIATDTYGDGFLFARVFEANVNQIRDPDLIYPGQVFILPE